MSDSEINAIITSVISTTIPGIFTIIYKLIDYVLRKLQDSTMITSTTRTAPSTLQSIDSFSMNRVMMHICILQFIIVIISSPLVTFTLGNWGILSSWLHFVSIFQTLVLSIGFMLSGTQVGGAIRWKHLFSVAIGVIIIRMFLQPPVGPNPLTLILGLVAVCSQTFLALGIGGVLASIVKGRTLAH